MATKVGSETTAETRDGVAAPHRWRAAADAARFMLSFHVGLTSNEPRHLRRVIFWIAPLGLAIGLAWAGAFRGAWRLFGETEGRDRVIPALVVVLLEALITGRYLPLALCRVVDVLETGGGAVTARAVDDLSTPPRFRGTLLLVLLVLTQWALILSVPRWNAWWPTDWRRYFNFLYPEPIYRPLLLAPLWGRWAILLAACVGRTARGVDAATAAMCAEMTPGRLLRNSILPLTLSCIYFSREQNFLIGAVIGLAVFAISYLASVFMARGVGGQTRSTLLATGQVAQIVFLVVYRALWPKIHL